MTVGLAFLVVYPAAIIVAPVARAEVAEVNESRAEMLVNRSGDALGARSELHDVRDSERYEWLLHPNPDFRAVREPKECGPTRDAPTQGECDAGLGR
jgi:hypothetical protein